jgi:hypothetical protein
MTILPNVLFCIPRYSAFLTLGRLINLITKIISRFNLLATAHTTIVHISLPFQQTCFSSRDDVYTVHANVHIRKFVQHMVGGALSILRLRLFPACSYNNVRTVCSVAETISSIAITNPPTLTRYMTDWGKLLNVKVTSLLRK